MQNVAHDEKGGALNLISRTPYVYNKTLTDANTEYSQALPANTTRFTLQARTSVDVKLCFTALASGTTYVTIKAGSSYSEEGLDLASTTLYMQSASAGIVVEVVAWTY